MNKLVTKTSFREQLGGLSRATFWKIEKADPNFPKPVPVSPGRQLYLQDEIDAYVVALASRRDVMPERVL